MKTRRPTQLRRRNSSVCDSKTPDWFDVNGIKYLREDLVNKKMDDVMERIAKALEVQSDFYKKWETHTEFIMQVLKELMEKERNKNKG